MNWTKKSNGTYVSSGTDYWAFVRKFEGTWYGKLHRKDKPTFQIENKATHGICQTAIEQFLTTQP